MKRFDYRILIGMLILGGMMAALVLWAGKSSMKPWINTSGENGINATSNPKTNESSSPPTESSTGNCTMPSIPEPDASQQQRATLGAYFFDGWAGPLTNFHFDGMVGGAYADRQPLSGWLTTPCSLEKQLVWAHGYGIRFFVFLYFPLNTSAIREINGNLNAALEDYRKISDHHGVKYALMYVNQGSFRVAPADWSDQVTKWAKMMTDPDYIKIDGKPLFMLIDADSMRQDFGKSSVHQALDELRTAARKEGLPGVFIVGGVNPAGDSIGDESRTPNLANFAADGYDALSLYNYPYVQPAIAGSRPYSDLVDAGEWIWNHYQAASPIPYIPVVEQGWDPRPWNEREPTTGKLMWYKSSPSAFGAFIEKGIQWADMHPRNRILPSDQPPLLLVEAWNELGEGSYLLPTIGNKYRFGQALAHTLIAKQTKMRTHLELETQPTARSWSAKGRLVDETGTPVKSAKVAIRLRPIQGAGVLTDYTHSGIVPKGAEHALVGFRVNTEGAGPGPVDFSLHAVHYAENGSDTGELHNSDFSLGNSGWNLQGAAKMESLGTGRIIRVIGSSGDTARLDSSLFPVTAGAKYQVTFNASISPQSDSSQYFMLIFFAGDSESTRIRIPAASASARIGTATTGPDGTFDLTFKASGQFGLQAEFSGDSEHWPAFIETESTP